MPKKIFIIIFLSLIFSFQGKAQLTEWEKDIERNGISFKKLRYSTHGIDTTGIIGLLSSEQEVEGIPCAKDWIHFSASWVPELFCLSTEHNVVNLTLPAGTWVILSPGLDYHTVVFPKDTLIADNLCRGGGGSNGARTKFYDTGELRSCFLKKNTKIDSVPCKGGIISYVQFHKNGKLYSASLSKDIKIQDYELVKGQKIYIDDKGLIITNK